MYLKLVRVKFINWEGTVVIYAGSGNMDAGWMS